MKQIKASGVLMHPTSLHNEYGCGDLGPQARRFVDFLHSSGQSYWQILPVQKPVAYSPYDCVSAFAGNPLLISTDDFVRDGLIKKRLRVPRFPVGKVNFRKAGEFRDRALREAYSNFRGSASFEKFCRGNAGWLDDFCDFEVLSEKYGKTWQRWPRKYRDRDPRAIELMREKNRKSIEEKKFIQWLFFSQWKKLKNYASARGVSIIGDIPMFVSLKSADVWAGRELFQLRKNGRPEYVAGVPPDYFSSTGQLWGNPVYDWKAMKKSGFEWWKRRFGHSLNLYDVVRIDHFRGFYSYWRVPARNRTAKAGHWRKVPGVELFTALKKEFGRLPVIAEDLGYIPPSVGAFREKLGFPGMKIIQFAFSKGRKNEHLPVNCTRRFVIYTGTHDNDTTNGWFRKCTRKEKKNVEKFMPGMKGAKRTDDVSVRFMEFAAASRAMLCIFPAQDILGLGSSARMNRPGRGRGNWSWRLSGGEFSTGKAHRLYGITAKYGRIKSPGQLLF